VSRLRVFLYYYYYYYRTSGFLNKSSFLPHLLFLFLPLIKC